MLLLSCHLQHAWCADTLYLDCCSPKGTPCLANAEQ